MASDLVTPRTFRVKPATRRSLEPPEQRGVVKKPGKRLEPAMRIEQPGKPPRFPEPKTLSGFCAVGGESRTEKECFVKTLFVGSRIADEYGVSPGAYLVSCSGADEIPGKPPQHWIRVSSAEDARQKAQRFCSCRKDGQSADRCAREIGAKRARRQR